MLLHAINLKRTTCWIWIGPKLLHVLSRSDFSIDRSLNISNVQRIERPPMCRGNKHILVHLQIAHNDMWQTSTKRIPFAASIRCDEYANVGACKKYLVLQLNVPMFCKRVNNKCTHGSVRKIAGNALPMCATIGRLKNMCNGTC